MRSMNISVFLTAIFLLVYAFYTESALAQDAICARVRVQLSQDVVIARNAFKATLEITNATENVLLEDLKVTLNITDANNQSANSLFEINPPELSGVGDVNGDGVIQPGTTASASWLIVPSRDAAPDMPLTYYVGGEFSYTQDGIAITVPLFPATILVKPDPLLVLDYFWAKDVNGDDPLTPEIEPAEPFSLGLMVLNNGKGVANNLRIVSSQPQIIENEKGLLVDFKIIGTQINADPVSPSLTVNLGNIDPGKKSVAQWIMTSLLQGTFIEYKASFVHVDGLGNPSLSLIDTVNIHELLRTTLTMPQFLSFPRMRESRNIFKKQWIPGQARNDDHEALLSYVLVTHVVRVDTLGDDSIPDFLANDSDTYKVYISDNVDSVVADQSSSSTLTFAEQNGSQSIYSLETTPGSGFIYLQLPDPFDGQKVITGVVRSDGKIIKSENVWLSKKREQSDPWQYFFNLFDADSTGTYTVTFGDPIPVPHQPVLQFIPDRTGVEGFKLSFIVQANDPDGTMPPLTTDQLPDRATFTDQGNGKGVFDWTPVIGQNGQYKITFMASDGALNDSQQVTLTINKYDPDADTDGDSYSNEDEIAAGSDPNNADSNPGTTILTLHEGYNLVNFPAETMNYGNLMNLMQTLGSNSIISKILVFNPDTQTYDEAGYDEQGHFYGQNIALPAGQGIAGMIVYAKQDATLTFTSKYCHTWNLKEGTNLVGTPCAADNLTSFELLQRIGDESVITSIQRYNRYLGLFETTSYLNGQPVGMDFPIKAGEGYFIYMKQDVTGFSP